MSLVWAWTTSSDSPGATVQRGDRARFAEAIFEDGAPTRLLLRLGSDRRAAVIFGAVWESRPRGAEADLWAGRLWGCRRVRVGQRGKAQLDDLFRTLTDLTLNTETNVGHAGHTAVTCLIGSRLALLPGSPGWGWAGRKWTLTWSLRSGGPHCLGCCMTCPWPGETPWCFQNGGWRSQGCYQRVGGGCQGRAETWGRRVRLMTPLMLWKVNKDKWAFDSCILCSWMRGRWGRVWGRWRG